VQNQNQTCREHKTGGLSLNSVVVLLLSKTRLTLYAQHGGSRTAWVVSIVPWVRTPWVTLGGRTVVEGHRRRQ